MEKLAKLERPSAEVAVVTLDNPQAQNFCTFAAVEALAGCLREARKGGATVTVLTSDLRPYGIQHAGLGDLHAMFHGRKTSGDGAAFFRCVHELTQTDVVTIAAVTGDCSGGGAELIWACDLRVAEESAHFGQPEVMIGLATGLGGTSRLMRLIGRTVTAEMVLDGAALTARRIYELGGVNRVVADGLALDTSVLWARRLADRSPTALATLKRILVESDELPLTEALVNEQKRFQESARNPNTFDRMAELQARFDVGETPRDVYDGPFDAND
jgi:enoyl-CoA hydratase/carnithine racemase